MMKKIGLVILLAAVLVGCGSLQRIQNFAKCKFEFEKVEKVRMGAIEVQSQNAFENLGLLEIGKLAMAIKDKKLALDMTALVKITNPNGQAAALNRTDWILMIDDVEVANGATNQHIDIPANGSSYLPLSASFNLFEVFSGSSKTAVFNLVENIAGVGDTPTNLKLKVKPSLLIAGIEMPMPGWMTLNRQVGK